MNLPNIVVLTATLVAFGALARPLATRLRLPVSILLALGGASLGFASLYSLDHPGTLLPVDLAALITDLPVGSSLFLYVLLPTLIFQSALVVDMQRVREDLLPIVLLALVAVLAATFGVALALWPIAGMPLLACLLLASLVATTDPVAVIAIFRDVGAPDRLTRLVEGESLFNDALAISLFLIFSAAIIAPGSVTVTGAALNLLLLPIGGGLFGYLMARLYLQLLRLIGDDQVTAVSLSLALPYLSFWIAEHVLQVSGIIAVATAGVALASLSPARVTRELWRHLDDTWQQLASWAAILVFVLTSLLVPKMMTDLSPFDFLLMLVIFAATLATRALVLFGLMPLLSQYGLSSRVSRPYRLVVLWGGLRGSMTLTLALAVSENDAVPRPVAAFVVTLATGYTLMTLFVQGTTLRPLIRGLGLDRLSGIDRAIRDLALSVTSARVARFAGEMAERFGGTDAAGHAEGVHMAVAAAEPAATSPSDTLSLDGRTAIALVSLTAREREMVLDHFANGMLAPRIARRLTSDTRRRLEMARHGGVEGYRAANAEETRFLWSDRVAFVVQRRLGRSRMLSKRLALRFEKLVEISLVLGRLRAFATSELQPVLGEETIAAVMAVLDERQARIDREIDAVRLQYPAYVAELERCFVLRAARAIEIAEIRRMRQSGVISKEIERDVYRSVARRPDLTTLSPPLDLGLDTRRLIDRTEIFAALGDRERDDLARLMTPFLAAPGMRIVSRGEVGDAAYFISSGAVEVDTGTHIVRLGRGDIFGEMALILDMRRQADVTAIAYSTMLRLARTDFARFVSLHPKLRARIEAIARSRHADNAKG